jgi:2-aminoadipate transaminase
VLADGPIIQQLVFAKQAADLQTNSFIQHVVYHYCRMGFFEKHIPVIIKDYAHRANVMLSALHEHFPPEVKFIEPDGGMFIWCTLPEGVKSSAVFKKAIQQKVAFVDGSVFYANGGGENTMRLNFTNSSDEAIRAGIKRLAAVIRSFL